MKTVSTYDFIKQYPGLKIKDLDSVHLGQVMKFINYNICTLKHDYYFVHKKPGEWAQFLANRDYAVLGAFDNDVLAAIATVHFPRSGGMRDAPEFKVAPDEELAIFQSVLVDARYRGRGFMGLMQHARAERAIAQGRKTAICKISEKNKASWQNALDFGFDMAYAAPDYSRHMKLYFAKSL
ncbi:MAG: GNAT family N-acetyltransferase [Alphaproteobacteria bacterium]|nr:GNAT family N-acetyltransferase [Alphaproteobacteria bacterium]